MTTIPQPRAETALPGEDPAEDADEAEAIGDDVDPLVHLREQVVSGLQALQRHASILFDQALESIYTWVITLCLGLLGMACFTLVSLCGCYYLISGAVGGLQELTGSRWLAHLLGGVIFLVLPVVAGWATLLLMKRRRAQHYAQKYRELLDEDQEL